MMTSLEMSLDEIIEKSKQSKKNEKSTSVKKNYNYRSSFKPKYRGLNDRGPRYNQVPIRKENREHSPTKFCQLYVSNLDESVTYKFLKEYFGAFGPLEKAKLNYDSAGNFLGNADVIYKNFDNALHVLNTCNGDFVKGRPLIISWNASTSSKSYSIGLESTSARKRRHQKSYANSGYYRRFPASKYKYQRKGPSIEELDAELDSYFKNE